MANAKIRLKLGELDFTSEGEEIWNNPQAYVYDMPEVKLIELKDRKLLYFIDDRGTEFYLDPKTGGFIELE